jgi:protein gp37
MSDGTAIEWTDATWNVITGCSVISPGCTNCYAMRLAGTRLAQHPSRAGLTRETKAGPVWTGEVRFNEHWLLQPLRWRRRRMIFVCAHADLFHDRVPDEWLDRVFAIMALCPQHIFQVLTKRPERMRTYMRGGWQARLFAHLRALVKRPSGHGVMLETVDGVLPNVWLGVSVEDRARMLERASLLADTPAAIRWWSAEPLLDDLGDIPAEIMPDWVVAGGESGPGARPMHPDWVRHLRDSCADAGIPFHFKQWGAWLPWEPDRLPYFRSQRGQLIDRHALPDFQDADLKGWTDACLYEGEDICVHELVGKTAAGRRLDGVEHNGFPLQSTTLERR